jgi:hypothetical protein
VPVPSANLGQILPYYWFYPPIIGNYCLLFAIICYYCFAKKFDIYWLLLCHAQTLIIAIIAKLLLQLIVSARNYMHYLQLFALFAIIVINPN